MSSLLKQILRAGLIVFGLALQACGGGSGGTSVDDEPDVDLLGSIGRFDIESSSPVLATTEGNAATYQVLEDNQLFALLPGEDVFSSLLSLPQWGLLEVSRDLRQFRYLPDADVNGSDGFWYVSGSRRIAVTIEIIAQDDAPRLDAEIARVATVGQLYSQVLQASDPDGDVLRYFTEQLPLWLSLDPASGVISGVPEPVDVGESLPFVIGVTDATGLSDRSEDVRITVSADDNQSVVDTLPFPDRLLGREVAEVLVIPDDSLGGLASLVVESNPLVDAQVSGGLVRLEAADVAEVTVVNLVVVLTDQEGVETRQIVPIELRPLTPSTLGQTLAGRRTGPGVNIVILGDGYRSEQRALFETDAEAVLETLEADPYVSDHLGLINLHAVWRESADSGADDDDFSDVRDTAFDARYNCNGVERLICANRLAVFEAAVSEYADVDEIVLLVNDARFGGSAHAGDGIAISSSAVPGLAIHEMGHSLASLGDEYVDESFADSIEPGNPISPDLRANIASDPASPPWQHWLSAGDVPGIDRDPSSPFEPGVFEGANYVAVGQYRPTLISRMRNVLEPFGPVNGEAWVLALYAKARPILGFQPVALEFDLSLGQLAEFSVTPWFDASMQRIEWQLDGNPLSEAITGGEPQNAAISLQLPLGRHELSLFVSDISGAIRQPGPHAGEFVWSWTINVL